MKTETVSALGAVASAAVAAGAVIVARIQILKQLREARERECRERVDFYHARLNHVDFLPILSEAVDLLATRPDHQEKAMAALRAGDTERRLRIIAVLNFFEELAGQYRDGLLDHEAADHILVPTLQQYWAFGDNWFIARVRATDSAALSEWHAMIGEVEYAKREREGSALRGGP